MHDSEVILEKDPEMEVFEENINDSNFLSKIRSSELARIGRKLMFLAAVLSPELMAQSSEGEVKEFQKQVENAKKAEQEIVDFVKPQKEGELTRKDYVRVEDVGVTNKKVLQTGFAATDGKRVQVKESGIKNSRTGEYRGTAYYWDDKNSDGRPEVMVSIDNVEPDAAMDSVAVSFFDKNLAEVAQENQEGSVMNGKTRVFFRDGSTWKMVKIGDPEVREIQGSDSYMQEQFASTAGYVGEKIKTGITQ